MTDRIPQPRLEPPVMTLSEARASGHARYLSGKPCRLDHIAQRFVKRDWCCDCARIGIKPNGQPKRKL
jgi:hypothetical protein